MAAYESIAQINSSIVVEESSFIAYKKSPFSPSYKIKSILKSVRKFFKKSKVSPIQYNGDASILEILPNEQQSVDISFYSEEECDNMENERLEAEMAARQ